MGVLGPKEPFYVELARDEWGPLMRRREVRLATIATTLGGLIVLVGFAVIFLARLPDIGPAFAGVFALGWGASTLWDYRALFRAWRRIGSVHLEFADGGLIVGEPAELVFVVVPRRDVTVREATITLRCRESGGGTGAAQWYAGLVFDAVLPQPPVCPRGAETRLACPVVLDPAAPTSRFEQSSTRQWLGTARLVLDDGAVWEREYPVLVYPR